MKTNEIKQHLMNGTLEDAIKVNNRQWFLIVVLFITIFGGYSAIITKRNINLSNEIEVLNDSITYKNTVIDIQHKTLDSAVFFQDILGKNLFCIK